MPTEEPLIKKGAIRTMKKDIVRFQHGTAKGGVVVSKQEKKEEEERK